MVFGSSKIVIYISLTHIVVGDCRADKPSFFQLDYQGDLSEPFKTIIEKFPSSNFKIILGSDVSYTVKWPKPSSPISREVVFTELTKYIPENFLDNQFDWKLDKENNIEAIVITTPIYKSLQQIKSKYPNISLDSVSSTSLLWEMGETNLSKETGGEIFMFMAAKSSPSGKDEKNLEIDISSKTIKSSSPSKSYLWIIIAAVIISMILAVIYYMISFKPKIQEVSISSPAPSIFITPAKNLSDYKITIRSTSSLTSVVNESLVSAGFSQITLENTGSPSATTKVILKEALPDDVQQKIITALGNRVPDISLTSFDNSESIDDIVILLGEQ